MNDILEIIAKIAIIILTISATYLTLMFAKVIREDNKIDKL